MAMRNFLYRKGNIVISGNELLSESVTHEHKHISHTYIKCGMK
jgi:hypothetical protein